MSPLHRRSRLVALSCLIAAACGEAPGPGEISFPAIGPLSAPAGRGGFRFGAATAATQIEDQNPATDWYLFTRPVAEGGLGRGREFVGDAVQGYTRALADVDLLQALRLDAYRFSIEWARIEPRRGLINEAALSHYGALLDRLRAVGIRPMITLHHFASPVWVDDPRDPECVRGPTDENLCGLGHPVGGPQVAAALARFARLLGERFGDRVDEWGTLNEPLVYLVAGYGLAQFPPGKGRLTRPIEGFVPVLRDYLDAHARMYHALKEADTTDADGDGVAASVGLSLSVTHFVAAQDNQVSDEPADLRARDRIRYLFHYLIPDSLRDGRFDRDLDGAPDEDQPGWRGTLDWLGVQYYSRMGVTGTRGLFPGLDLTPCLPPLDVGSCVPALDLTYCVPAMGYEAYPPGLHAILTDLSARFPALPLMVTEAGLATTVGRRRAEHIVRTLEQIDRARRDGVDVRGYYHWSLMDNFEWALGFTPRFGLYAVDRGRPDYPRAPTEGASLLGSLAKGRRLTGTDRERLGGEGPLTPEASPPATVFCR